MKVLHVFGSMDIGGAEMRTLELMRELAPRGVEFHFLTLSGREGVLAQQIRDLGGQVHPVALSPGFPARYVALLRTLRPQVVDSHVATFSGALLLGAWLCHVPRRVAHFRSDGDGHVDSLRRRSQRSLMRALIRGFATDIVGVSPSSLSDGYRKDWATDARARVLVNGIPRFVPDPEGASLRELVAAPGQLLLHVGRPSPEKNRVHTVRVLRALCDRGGDWHLALVGGQGADSEQVMAEASRLMVTGRVHDLGSRLDARQLMSGADVVLLTSLREGLPGVVIESLSTGTPVVASALPGVQFIASHVPGVYPVSLESPVDAWAVAVEMAAEAGRSLEWRRSLESDFDSSLFAHGTATREHLRLYSGTGHE
ncbi:glycosyltransferase [Pedococcus sp. 5OH_020]|uniref:glycosyltransferase n=1 Tax=Pedococcus sp. 5OH_020 TaxID=2989814 RepID=UPI0022E9AF3B|nr:glycosyltransferase [Pedococcus sp. 5OH_020]